MKWFKHDATAQMDAKLRKLRSKYGMEGYGLYWYCLELIAQNVEKHNLTFELEHDAEIIAFDTNISAALVQEMMRFMVELKLFEMAQPGVITCLKMRTRTDEYTQKLIKSNPELLPNPDKLQTLSGQNPRKSDLIEEKEEIDKTSQTDSVESRPKQKKFSKPTIEQIREYCRERHNSVNPQRFFDHYESNGWKVGKNPMKCWKAAVRTWERNDLNSQCKGASNSNSWEDVQCM